MSALYWTALTVIVLLAMLACGRREVPAPDPEQTYMDAIVEETPPAPQVITTFTAPFTDEEITAAAKALWGEARGVDSRMEQAAVVWCFLNRVDARGSSLGDVVTAPGQFAYDAAFPTVDDAGRDLAELVRDVISRWAREQDGASSVGRVLPAGYLYFGGEGGRNWFRTDYDSFDNVWDWSLPNPYEEKP